VEKIKPERSRKRKIIIFAVATVVNIGLLALLAWQLLTPAQSPHDVSGRTGSNVIAALKGRSAPNFTQPALSDQHIPQISLADYKGKAVVLNFWASWCGPCQDEASLFQAEWQKVQSRNIVFLGVDFQDTQADGLNFLHKYHITYPNIADAAGITASAFGLSYTPTTYFINSKGIVVNSIAGELTAQQLAQNVQALL
jgi:cytochrome c biogenesis protein CcmG/thiol:disulfide interchange protein DsbE